MSTLAAEIEAKINRVRLLIGDAHWGSEGAYKEALVRQLLRKWIPSCFRVSTGFVYWAPKVVSPQLDVIVWDPSVTVPFVEEGEFVVLPPDGVRAVVEVKTTLSREELRTTLKDMHIPAWRNYTNLPPRSPIRAVVAFKHTLPSDQNTPWEACFEELHRFYYELYGPGSFGVCSQREGVTEVTSGDGPGKLSEFLRPRYLNLLDGICIVNTCSIEQAKLGVAAPPENPKAWRTEPCFVALCRRDPARSLALAQFIMMMQDLLNRIAPTPVHSPFAARQDLQRGLGERGVMRLGSGGTGYLFSVPSPDGLTWEPPRPLW